MARHSRRREAPDNQPKGFDALASLTTPEKAAANIAERNANAARTNSKPARVVDKPKERPLAFHNPYNFVPILSRENVTGELGDRQPTSHGSYKKEAWSGRLSLELTTKTPLLIPDAAMAVIGEKKHRSFPLRIVSGRPYLAPTSIKGMLRSAYEAVTNSRISIFQEHHKDRLAYRMSAKDGLSLVPVRISEDGETIELLMGNTDGIPSLNDRGNWDVPSSFDKDRGDHQYENMMYAAWLPRYKHNSAALLSKDKNTSLYKDEDHRRVVKAWVQKVDKYQKNKKGEESYRFSYWRVCKNGLAFEDETLADQPELEPVSTSGQHRYTDKKRKIEKGYLCLTGKNIGNKYNERLFFVDDNHPLRERLCIRPDAEEINRLRKEWKELIQNYQQEHAAEIASGESGPPQAKKGAQWSYHITDEGRGLTKKQEAMLCAGTLCYAAVSENNDGFKVESLYPVMIARRLFERSPLGLLSKSLQLQPATNFDQLSPADRVFGWAHQDGSGAHKGQLRVHSSECVTQKAVKEFTNNPKKDPGLALSILGQPKPTQSRFYIAQSNGDNTIALPLEGQDKQAGYQVNQMLRGRKVYPHHQVDDTYWSESRETREYARPAQSPDSSKKPVKKGALPEQERDSQNRSIQNWVRPGSKFKCCIDIINLSAVEVGALIWLLDLEEEHYHRIGGGKPFGFGSMFVSINWEESDLRLGSKWNDHYSQMKSPEAAGLQKESKALKENFEIELETAYEDGKKILDSFKRMSKGFEDDLPIQYPRNQSARTSKDENFKWFERNERTDKRALDLLLEDKGLPRF